MNSKVDPRKAASPSGDIVKYALALLLVIGGVFAFYWFAQWAMPLRVLSVIAGLVLGTVVFMASGKGGQTREFLSESVFELRKVVWPTRQEATRLTWVVVIVVIIISLILAAFDSVIQVVIKWLLGQ